MKTLMNKLEALGFTKETGLDGLSLNNVAVSLHWSGEEAVVAVDGKQVFSSESEEEIITFVKTELNLDDSEEAQGEVAKYDDYKMLDVKKALTLELRNKADRLERSFQQHEYTVDEIKQSIDDTVTNFMIENWGVEWEQNSQASAFYENTACPARIDLEFNMIDLYNENI